MAGSLEHPDPFGPARCSTRWNLWSVYIYERWMGNKGRGTGKRQDGGEGHSHFSVLRVGPCTYCSPCLWGSSPGSLQGSLLLIVGVIWYLLRKAFPGYQHYPYSQKLFFSHHPVAILSSPNNDFDIYGLSYFRSVSPVRLSVFSLLNVQKVSGTKRAPLIHDAQRQFKDADRSLGRRSFSLLGKRRDGAGIAGSGRSP